MASSGRRGDGDERAYATRLRTAHGALGMSAIVDALLAELDDQALDALAELLAPRLADRLAQRTAPAWLDAAGAAEYLAASRERIYDLVQLEKLRPERDGRRLLFRRDDLDAYLGSRSVNR